MNLRRTGSVSVLAFISLLPGGSKSQGSVPTQGLDTRKRHGGLELGDLQLSKDAHIVGLEFHLAGTFESVSNIPSGWIVSVDNESSGEASIQGHVKAGSSAVNEYALRNIGLQVVVNGLDELRPQVWGWVLIASNGHEKERRMPLSSYNFDFVERYHRHRLSQDINPSR